MCHLYRLFGKPSTSKLWIIGDLWQWFYDYLNSSCQYADVGASNSSLAQCSGVTQGSVLEPILFTLHTNELPAPPLQSKMWVSRCMPMILRDGLHSKKSEVMLISRQICWPFRSINRQWYLNQLSFTRCFGVVLDDQISWTLHLEETTKLFANKLNLLKSLNFLPAAHLPWNLLLQCYLSLSHLRNAYLRQLLQTLFQDIKRMHVRAAEIIYKFRWRAPSAQV